MLPTPYNDKALRAAIVGALRQVWHRYQARRDVLKAAERRLEVITKSGAPGKRPAVFYKCAQCGCLAKSKATETHPGAHVDHIDPVVPTDRILNSWDELIARMFCDPSNLQVICSTCHRDKTSRERVARNTLKGAS